MFFERDFAPLLIPNVLLDCRGAKYRGIRYQPFLGLVKCHFHSPRSESMKKIAAGIQLLGLIVGFCSIRWWHIIENFPDLQFASFFTTLRMLLGYPDRYRLCNDRIRF